MPHDVEAPPQNARANLTRPPYGYEKVGRRISRLARESATVTFLGTMLTASLLLAPFLLQEKVRLSRELLAIFPTVAPLIAGVAL